MEKNRIQVAFIGAGYMTSEHLKAFSGLDGVDLVGLHSRTRENADQLAKDFGVSVYDSIAELYQNTNADLVVVSVPELAMRQVATRCFEFSWTVFLEKPAGYNLQDAIAIHDAAKARKSQVYVALNRRAYSSTRQALSILAEQASPRFIKVQDQQDQQSAKNDYGQPDLIVQNYMYANSIHVIDYFRVFGRGEIIDVEQVVSWNPEKPGLVLVKISFSSGDIGLYEGIWDGPGPWAVSISSPDQRLEMRPLEQVSLQVRNSRENRLLELDRDDVDYKPGLRFQAKEAVEAARGQPANLATLEDSLASMHLVARIFGMS